MKNLIQALLEKSTPHESLNTALSDLHQNLNYSQVCEIVDVLSAELSTYGVASGERVLLQMQNSIEYVVAFFAVIKLGAIVVPLDHDAGPERTRFVVTTTTPKILITNTFSKKAPSNEILNLTVHLSSEKVYLNNVLLEFKDLNPTTNSVGPDSMAAIIFSSGSTGQPKGVVLRHRHLLATARNLATLMKLNSTHKELILSPICHTDGWQRVAATLFAGGCVKFYDQPLTVPHFVDFASRNDITGFYSPPPFVRYLIRSSPSKFHETCKNIEIGSAPLSSTELNKLLGLFPNAQVFVHFGLTESSRALAYSCRMHPDKLHTVGKALPGVKIKIVDSEGNSAPVDSVGEVYLQGSQCTDTYWQRDDLNENSFLDGWLKTGDFGSLDSDGFLTYQGRRDDMINFGGFHFFPNEVEKELGPVPGLHSYLVVGSPDPAGIMEKLPIMYAVKNPDASWSADEFFTYAKKKLPVFKIPRKVIFVPEIIRTHSGKPDRKKMFATYGAS